MSQNALFDAEVYVRKAYDALVLAYDRYELEELYMLKNAVLRGYVSLKVIQSEQLELDDVTRDEAPF